MKNLLIIIILTLSLNCLGQNQSQERIEKAAQKVGIETSKIFSNLSTSQSFENQTLVVIPEIAEEGEGYGILNSHIILLDDKNGEVIAKFTRQKDWYLDATSIENIEIESITYPLNEKIIAFGIRINYYSNSSPNPYSSTQLSLYALEGNKLNRVLEEFPIKTFRGETDTTCKGKFEEHSKIIQVLDTYTNEFADLRFTNKIELSTRNKDCDKTITETKTESEILKYVNGEYKKVL